MRYSIFISLTLFVLLSCIMVVTARAENVEASVDVNPPHAPFRALSDPNDPANELVEIRARGLQRDSLLPVSPLVGLHNLTSRGKGFLDEKFGLELALAFNHLFQGLSKALPGEDHWGTTTDMDFYATLKLINKGRPSQGQVFFQLEGRWDYGTVGPTELGNLSLGSMIFTANAFSEYRPHIFLPRNLFWQQGSSRAGWFYRIGKITPDQTLGTSAYLSPTFSFLTIAGTGTFSIALPDSGLGISGGYTLIKDRLALVGVFSDANANRQNWGDIGAGDFFEGVDIAFKIAPRTEKAGYSKLTLWHTDGTKDLAPINGMTGPSGWGFALKLEQELTADGRAIGIARYGKSFDDSALYDQQAGLSLLYIDPHVIGHIRNDLVGLAFNWAKVPQEGTRSEYNVEIFYKFPFFPLVDTTLSYQSVINPALTREINHASAFSLRLRTTF